MKTTKEMTMIKVEDLIPYANNARSHGPEQINKLRSSLREFGFVNPILIDRKNNVIAGHGRLAAAKAEGILEVPCVFVDHLTKAQKKAYIIADNRTAIDAGWDEELLKIELEDLQEESFDLSLTGFDDDELSDLFKDDETPIEEDDYDIKIPEEPKAKLGDIYQLGNHRLMCGDSTSIDDVEKLIDGAKINFITCDPPYGMNAVSKSGLLSKKYDGDIMNDDNNQVAIDSFNLCISKWSNVKQVWWGANYYTECLPSSECWIVWDKNNGASDQTDCELAWTNFRSVVRQFTIASEQVNRVHPTQKPCRLLQQIFNKFDKKNEFDKVMDLFGGSGSTLIACEQLNKKCFMMELDPKYVDEIIERWEKFTRKKAILLNGQEIIKKEKKIC